MLDFKVQYNLDKKFTNLRKLKRALKINALEIQSIAKSEVNVDTGLLQSSINIETNLSETSIRIGSIIEYAAAQESIKSYLENALTQQEPILIKDIENAIVKP